MDANGYIEFPSPIIVFPEILTCEWIIVLLPILTFGPMTEYGPIFTLGDINAFELIIAVLWIIYYP